MYILFKMLKLRSKSEASHLIFGVFQYRVALLFEFHKDRNEDLVFLTMDSTLSFFQIIINQLTTSKKQTILDQFLSLYNIKKVFAQKIILYRHIQHLTFYLLNESVCLFLCVCVCACVRMRVCACVRMCVCAQTMHISNI